jgi:hypothetical protein
VGFIRESLGKGGKGHVNPYLYKADLEYKETECRFLDIVMPLYYRA